MKKFILFTLTLISFTLLNCSSDDDSGTPTPTNGTIRFEVETSMYRDAIIVTRIDDMTETSTHPVLPFGQVFTDVALTSGKYLQLVYTDDDFVGFPGTLEYTAELRIIIDNIVVKSETFTVTETTTGNGRSIDYVIP